MVKAAKVPPVAIKEVHQPKHMYHQSITRMSTLPSRSWMCLSRSNSHALNAQLNAISYSMGEATRLGKRETSWGACSAKSGSHMGVDPLFTLPILYNFFMATKKENTRTNHRPNNIFFI